MKTLMKAHTSSVIVGFIPILLAFIFYFIFGFHSIVSTIYSYIMPVLIFAIEAGLMSYHLERDVKPMIVCPAIFAGYMAVDVIYIHNVSYIAADYQYILRLIMAIMMWIVYVLAALFLEEKSIKFRYTKLLSTILIYFVIIQFGINYVVDPFIAKTTYIDNGTTVVEAGEYYKPSKYWFGIGLSYPELGNVNMYKIEATEYVNNRKCAKLKYDNEGKITYTRTYKTKDIADTITVSDPKVYRDGKMEINFSVAYNISGFGIYTTSGYFTYQYNFYDNKWKFIGIKESTAYVNKDIPKVAALKNQGMYFGYAVLDDNLDDLGDY